MVPLGVAGIITLTGAAVLVPLQLSVNDTAVDLDAEIRSSAATSGAGVGGAPFER
ncbi:hypothetical protein FB560_2567 [Microbacterium saperdae]|uniref:Uncharacterized protein n=1 Tax=Microbacterium saperdae TaxID=69368 RepID=A0A543BQ11_9MICO|nr:hypothetical protein FB560_2567 [Microbacterium saperdae]